MFGSSSMRCCISLMQGSCVIRQANRPLFLATSRRIARCCSTGSSELTSMSLAGSLSCSVVVAKTEAGASEGVVDSSMKPRLVLRRRTEGGFRLETRMTPRPLDRKVRPEKVCLEPHIVHQMGFDENSPRMQTPIEESGGGPPASLMQSPIDENPISTHTRTHM